MEFRTWTWEKIHASNLPTRRAYLQIAIVQNQLYIFGGFTGQKCIADFRSLPLPDPDFGSLYASERISLQQKLQASLLYLTGTEESEGLNREGLRDLLGILSRILPKQIRRQGKAPEVSFDSSAAPKISALGFERSVVLATMQKLHEEGQDPSRVTVVVDRLLNNPAAPAQNGSAADPSAELAWEEERKELEAKHSQHLRRVRNQLEEEKEELRQCKICYDGALNAVLEPCHHLAGCINCCKTLQACVSDLPGWKSCSLMLICQFSVLWNPSISD